MTHSISKIESEVILIKFKRRTSTR